MKKITLKLLQLVLFICGVTTFAQTNDLPCGATDLDSFVNNSGVCDNQIFSFSGTETISNVGTPNCGADLTGDLWYSFTMPDTGAARIIASFESDIYDLAIELFYGDDCNNLTSFACDDDGNPDGGNSALFPQIEIVRPAGSKVTFRVWDLDDLGSGSFNICIAKIDAPLIATNSDCVDATQLPLETVCTPVLATNYQATPSGEIAPTCGILEGNDVWFYIDVDDLNSYDITIETSEASNSAFLDTGIAIYSGTCGNLSELACDDDSGVNAFSKVTIPNRRNETLLVRVFPSFISDQTGTFNICATYSTSLDVDDQLLGSTFSIFPNPAKDIVNLKFNQIKNNSITIRAYNIQGKLVLYSEKQLQNKKTQLDISSLTSGLYFLKIFNGDMTSTKKLIIK